MDAKTKSEIIINLFEIDAFKFGNFVLKSKTTSPIYIDFRGIISSPALMVLLVMSSAMVRYLSHTPQEYVLSRAY